MSCLTDTGVTGMAFPSPAVAPRVGGGWKEASPLLLAVPPDGQAGLRALSRQRPRLTPPTLTLKQAPEGRRAVPSEASVPRCGSGKLPEEEASAPSHSRAGQEIR